MNLLLSHKADVKYQGGDQNNTALHVAVELGDVRAVKTILTHCIKHQNESELQECLFKENKSGEIALTMATRLSKDQSGDSPAAEVLALLTDKHNLCKQKED